MAHHGIHTSIINQCTKQRTFLKMKYRDIFVLLNNMRVACTVAWSMRTYLQTLVLLQVVTHYKLVCWALKIRF